MNKSVQKNIKHVPIRTCIGTGKKFPKQELIRVVSQNNETLQYDITGKKPGRGANLSLSQEALDLALKKRSFDRSFKRKITKDEIKYLKDNFNEVVEQKLFRLNPNKKVLLRVTKEQIDHLSM